MPYRLNAQFRDGSTNNPHTNVVETPAPRCGDTIAIARHGQSVPMRVIATWTPSTRMKSDGLTMVEAREI
jgi:hypothetical protein